MNPLNELIQDVVETGKSRTCLLSSFELFVELIEPETHMVVMGGNYDVLPVLAIADNLGWHKTIVTNPKRLYPPARQFADQINSELSEVNIDGHAVGIVMSHDYKADLFNLRQGAGLRYAVYRSPGPCRTS